MNNSKIAGILNEIADLLEIQGANPFRIRSYRHASQTIEACREDIASRVRNQQDLTELDGIGESMAQKLQEIVREGDCREHRQLLEQIPAGLLDFLKIPGLGPKKAGLIYKELHISTLSQLEQAATAGKLRLLPGMGQKTEEKILHGLEVLKKMAGRVLWIEAEVEAQAIRQALEACPQVQKLEIAGSYRRKRDSIGDLDFLVIGSPAEPIMQSFVGMPEVKEILASGETKSAVRLDSGLQADLRVVPQASYGAALQYFTGSQAHNIALRERAKRMGFKINEYGVFQEPEGARCPAETEEEVYKILGLAWIPPELRENRGEIERAMSGSLPVLIELSDIRGDLHNHTKASDGSCSLEELLLWGDCLGYEYLAVTDHSKSLTVANGLDERRLRMQMEQIDRLNSAKNKIHRVHLLKGCEVDIKADGSLDLDEDLLSELDLVIAAIHSHMSMAQDEMTERIITALAHPCVHILAHPTGRILMHRESFALDMDRIFSAAARYGVALELNAYPARLDLNDLHCRTATEKGVSVAINSDSHAIDHFHFMRYGIFQARRGWLEKRNVLNSLPHADLLKTLHQKKTINL